MTASPFGNLRASTALSRAELGALVELERTCAALDGGRLKLEYPALAERRADRESDFTWWVHGELVGFLGIYQWQPAEVEMAGMVHPRHRRLGVFSRLFEAAMAELCRRAAPRVLLVMDRRSDAGHAFASHVDAVYEHSEHRMVQRRAPSALDPDRSLELRPALAGVDSGFISECLSAAFGIPCGDVMEDDAAAVGKRHLVVERDGEPVGTLRVDCRKEGGKTMAGIYGFAVLPDHQGRGIGRCVLTELIARLRGEGVDEITLEVSVSNDAALKVYESCGFDRVGTDDYFMVQRGRPHGQALHPTARASAGGGVRPL